MANEEIEIEAPTLTIPLELYRKLLAYVAACDNEISGFFEVDYDEKDNQFKISKVYDLLKQEVSGGDVEIDEEEVGKFNAKLVSEGAKQLPRGWWHSHNDMSAFLSVTDTTTIEKLSNNSYIVAVVLNKAREIHAVVQLFQPIKLSIEMKVITDYHDTTLMAKAEKEVKEKVTEARPTGYTAYSKENDDYVHPSWGKKHKKRNGRNNKTYTTQYGYDAAKDMTLRAFPEDRKAAVDLVIALNLERRYDQELRCIIYTDREANVLYMDEHDTFTYEEFTDINKGSIQTKDLQ